MRRRWCPRRDPGAVPTLMEVIALARQARTDPAARAVLHDALLERYPAIYGRLVRSAESAKAGWVGKAYAGPRVIGLDPRELMNGERHLAELAAGKFSKKGRPATAEAIRRSARWVIGRAFVTAVAYPSWPGFERGTIEVYRSRRVKKRGLTVPMTEVEQGEFLNRLINEAEEAILAEEAEDEERARQGLPPMQRGRRRPLGNMIGRRSRAISPTTRRGSWDDAIQRLTMLSPRERRSVHGIWIYTIPRRRPGTILIGDWRPQRR